MTINLYITGDSQRIPDRAGPEYSRLLRGNRPGRGDQHHRHLLPAGRLRLAQGRHLRHSGPQLGPLPGNQQSVILLKCLN